LFLCLSTALSPGLLDDQNKASSGIIAKYRMT
jgi:hypothetical protein